jgi:hypothetical protein
VDSEKKGELIEIAGLWKSKDGRSLSGGQGNARWIVIPNQFKKDDKHPDYKLFVAKNEKREKDVTKEDAPF